MLLPRLRTKLSSVGRHNDARKFLQLPLSSSSASENSSGYSQNHSAFQYFRNGTSVRRQHRSMSFCTKSSTILTATYVTEDYQHGMADKTTKEAEEICKLLVSNKQSTSTVEAALRGSSKFEFKPSPALVLEVLMKLSNAGLLALHFFQWAEKQQGFEHTTEVYNALIESLGKIKQFKMVWVLVESMKSKGLLTKDTFMFIIRRYARANRVAEAVKTFEKMEEYGLKPDSADFNRFLSSLSKSRQVCKAQELFDEMKNNRKFDPDKKTYGILLEGWGERLDLTKLETILEEMDSEGVEHDTYTYGIVINAYCKAGRVHRALEKFQEMEAKNCKPTSHIYCTLINGFGSRERLDEAINFFEMSKASGLKLEAPTYNALVGSYCWSLKFDDAYKTVEEMRRTGVGPNSRTYHVILHHLIKADRTKEACDLFHRMSKGSEEGCRPSLSTYEMMLRMFCKQGKLGEAIQMWDQMKSEAILPSRHMFSTLIYRLCTEKRLEDACKYFKEMLDVGIRPPGRLFGNLKRALEADGKSNTVVMLSRKLDKIRRTPEDY